MNGERTLYQVWLTPAEHDELRRLAEQTGRNRANVLKSLIRLAAAEPATLARLGSLPPALDLKPAQPERT